MASVAARSGRRKLAEKKLNVYTYEFMFRCEVQHVFHTIISPHQDEFFNAMPMLATNYKPESKRAVWWQVLYNKEKKTK